MTLIYVLKLLDIRKLKPLAEEIWYTLPEERRQKALRYRKEEDRMRSIGSAFLIMKTISWQKESLLRKLQPTRKKTPAKFYLSRRFNKQKFKTKVSNFNKLHS